MYVISTAQKQYIRENYRRFFDTKEPHCMLYLHNNVTSLWAIKEVNNLRKTLGDSRYETMKTDLDKFQKLYNYALYIQDTIRKLKDTHSDSQDMKTKIREYSIQLAQISSKMPGCRWSIIMAFFLLMNNTDMKNVAIPKRETRIPHRQGELQ